MSESPEHSRRSAGRILAPALLALLLACSVNAQPVDKAQVEELGLDPISFRGPDPRDRFKDIKIQQNLGAQLPLDLTFRNEQDEEVRLSDYFDGERPVVISMVYYGCPMLCTLVLNGMVAAFDGQPDDFKLGTDYTVISVSIDPKETGALASEKKANYVADLHIDGAAENWHFLTGDQDNIETLAQVLGFRYYYDEASGQYAHDSGVMILTPHGEVSSYYLGIEYMPKNLRTALEVAATDTIGEYLEQPTLLCFAYDPTSGKYGLVIIGALQVGGVGTVLLIVAFWIVSYRRANGAASRLNEAESRAPSLSGSV